MTRDPLPHHQRVAVLGKAVLASDANAHLDATALAARLPGLEVHLGTNTLGDATAVVTSPGLPPDTPILVEAAAKGLEVIAEIELAFRATHLPMVAVTGTDGKTTTTLMTAHLLRAAGVTAHLGGNIGTPLSEVVLAAKEGWLVVEVSAFQLPFAPTFAPQVLIATNIAEDHMDFFHGRWDDYVAAKRRPLTVMGPETTAVLNADNPVVRTWDRHGQAQVAWYGRTSDLANAAGARAWVTPLSLHATLGEACVEVPLAALRIPGAHNQLNAMAALLGALATGVAPQPLGTALATFTAPAHRIETVRTIGAVSYVNDSKATNPHAATAGLMTVAAPVILIAGGVDKGLHLEAWIDSMAGRVEAVVLIGELKTRLAEAIRASGSPIEIHACATMDDAVDLAAGLAARHQAQTVLLSPGCSSYDMFTSYTHRGDAFRSAVAALVP